MAAITYDTIRAMAKEQGCRVTDLIALAPQNDPFYTGTPGEVEKAQWFAELWQRFGYTTGVHIRRVHYQIVSQDPPILKPNGLPYENTENDWAYLCLAAKAARYLGLVRPEAFVDQRNPDPMINVREWTRDPNPNYYLEISWRGFDFALPTFPALPDFRVSGYTDYDVNLQPYLLEVWVEKTTMNDVLEPLCHQYEANLVTGAGELSITATVDFLKRAQASNRPCRIFYISDFDPAGYGMPVSIARKIEYFVRERGLPLDIRLQPIALTREQVISYQLPRTPIKESERRKAHFEDVHGQGGVELDALEALHPGELARIVREAILEYYDEDIEDEARRQEDALQEALAQARQEVLDEFPGLDELREEFDSAVADFGAQVESLRERMQETYSQLVERLEAIGVDVEDYPVPEPKQTDEPNGLLFASERDYLSQLESYTAYRNGHNLKV